MAKRVARKTPPATLDAVTVKASERFLESRAQSPASAPGSAAVSDDAPTLFAGCFYALWDQTADAPVLSPSTNVPYLFTSYTQAQWSRSVCLNAPQKARHAPPRVYEIITVRLSPLSTQSTRSGRESRRA